MKIQALVSIIVAAINQGSVLYNSGKVKECANLYASIALSLLTSNDIDGIPKDELEYAMSQSITTSSDDEKAWCFRDAFDSIIEYSQRTDFAPCITGQQDTAILCEFNDESDIDSWFRLHDGVMGGISEGKLDYNAVQKDAVFSGVVRTEYNGGFATVRRSLDIDASAFNGIFLDISSNEAERIYSLNLKDSICIRNGSNFKSKFLVSVPYLLFLDT